MNCHCNVTSLSLPFKKYRKTIRHVCKALYKHAARHYCRRQPRSTSRLLHFIILPLSVIGTSQFVNLPTDGATCHSATLRGCVVDYSKADRRSIRSTKSTTHLFFTRLSKPDTKKCFHFIRNERYKISGKTPQLMAGYPLSSTDRANKH